MYGHFNDYGLDAEVLDLAESIEESHIYTAQFFLPMSISQNLIWKTGNPKPFMRAAIEIRYSAFHQQEPFAGTCCCLSGTIILCLYRDDSIFKLRK